MTVYTGNEIDRMTDQLSAVIPIHSAVCRLLINQTRRPGPNYFRFR